MATGRCLLCTDDVPDQATALRHHASEVGRAGLAPDDGKRDTIETLELEQLAARFLTPPLYSTAYEMGFGTLYTALYQPADLAIEYRWPGSTWRHSVRDFSTGQHAVVLGAATQVPM